jgi:hypothetical protein
VVLLAVLIGTMIMVPADLRMEAKGQMLPVEIAKVFPPREGWVQEIRAKPGDKIDPGFEIAALISREFGDEYSKATRELAEANAAVEAAAELLSKPGMREDDKLRALTDKKTAESRRDKALQDIRTLDLQYNAGRPNRTGYFRACAPQFDPQLARPIGRSQWTVLNDDRRENLIGRTLRPNEEIMRLGNLGGAWQAELKIPQRNVGQVLRAFSDPNSHFVEKDPVKGDRKYLVVDVLLSSDPDTSYEGRLYRDDVAAEAVPNKNEHDENEPVVTAYVKLNVPGIDESNWVPRNHFVTGLEVRTRVRCGKHALGYTLFHGVWEWFYEKVVFFF